MFVEESATMGQDNEAVTEHYFDDGRRTHPTPLRHKIDGIVLTPDTPYSLPHRSRHSSQATCTYIRVLLQFVHCISHQLLVMLRLLEVS